jgi:hypothetical protein
MRDLVSAVRTLWALRIGRHILGRCIIPTSWKGDCARVHLPCVLISCVLFAVGGAVEANATITQVFDPGSLTGGPFTIEDFEDDAFEPGITYSASSGVQRASAASFARSVTPSGFWGLSSNSPPDPISLTFDLETPASSVGMWFGNDDTCCSTGFVASLDIFDAGGFIGTISLAANMNDFADQFLGFNSTELVTSVTLRYGSGSDVDLFHYIDDVYFNVAPQCFAIDAIDDQFSVINDGSRADFSVLENDECSSDMPISVVALPGDLLPDRGGSATTDGDTVSYTPAAGFVGFEEFAYTAQDAGLEGGADPPAVDQDTAVVVVDVLENLIPDAVDDVAEAQQDQALIIDVLENDSLGNAPNAVEIETDPANGSATLQADNTIQYSPNADFFGEDSLEYRLTDVNGDSDVATVTVGVFFVRGQVSIDIMPNSDGNNLNLRAGQGAGIDVAILSAGEFFEAPNLIDPLTLKFGPRGANIWGSPQVRDVDGDGDDDLVVKFLIQQTGIACGDAHATVSGRTFGAQSISGTDAINTFSCPRVRKRH